MGKVVLPKGVNRTRLEVCIELYVFACFCHLTCMLLIMWLFAGFSTTMPPFNKNQRECIIVLIWGKNYDSTLETGNNCYCLFLFSSNICQTVISTLHLEWIVIHSSVNHNGNK